MIPNDFISYYRHFGIFKFVGGLFTKLFGWVDIFGVWLGNKGGKIKSANVNCILIWQQKWRN
jgi:hypothetical protein